MNISQKICLIGDFGVGKTSLIRGFVDRQFSDQYLSTVGVKISRKLVAINSQNTPAKKIQLLIWDIEGQSKFRSLLPNYLQGAGGAIIVADLSRQETIDHIREHIELFSSVNPKVKVGNILVVLNKSDLLDQESLEKCYKQDFFCQQNQVIATYTTSAKTGENVDQIFHDLACSLYFN